MKKLILALLLAAPLSMMASSPVASLDEVDVTEKGEGETGKEPKPEVEVEASLLFGLVK